MGNRGKGKIMRIKSSRRKLSRLLIGIVKILLLIMLILIPHELGHFFFMRLYGIPVEELSLGFGKLLASTNAGGTMLSLRMIPLGGYALAGFNPTDLPLLSYIIMVSAGGVANLITAFLLKKRWKNVADIVRFNGWANLLPIFAFSDGARIMTALLLVIGINKVITTTIVLISGVVIIFLYFLLGTSKREKERRESARLFKQRMEEYGG